MWAAGEDGGAGQGARAAACAQPKSESAGKGTRPAGNGRPRRRGLGGRASWRGRAGGGTWERRADRARGPIPCRCRPRAGCSPLGGRREAGWASPVSWGLPSLLRAWPWCCARELARRRVPRAAGAAPAQQQQPVARRAEHRSPRPASAPPRPAPARLSRQDCAPGAPFRVPAAGRRCPHARGARRAARLGLWAISSGPELPPEEEDADLSEREESWLLAEREENQEAEFPGLR